MSETATLRIEFDNKEDAIKCYGILIEEDERFCRLLLEPASNILNDNSSASSYDDFEILSSAARTLSKRGISFNGVASYESLSVGSVQEERFKCEGDELIVLDEQTCMGCGEIVSSSNGIHAFDGISDLWYCENCGKRYLIDYINDYLDDNDELLEDYSDKKDLNKLSLEELSDIASQMDDLEIDLPNN